MNKVIESIKNSIQNDLNGHSLKGVHGITKDNIQNHLIEPRLDKYIGSVNNVEILEVWTVLEEHPKQNQGYTIFFDQEKNMFGLGLYVSSNQLMHIGIYGSFVETLNSM